MFPLGLGPHDLFFCVFDPLWFSAMVSVEWRHFFERDEYYTYVWVEDKYLECNWGLCWFAKIVAVDSPPRSRSSLAPGTGDHRSMCTTIRPLVLSCHVGWCSYAQSSQLGNTIICFPPLEVCIVPSGLNFTQIPISEGPMKNSRHMLCNNLILIQLYQCLPSYHSNR